MHPLQNFNAADIQAWSRFYRANFINSLTGYKPVSLIGTVNAEGQTNLGLFSSIVHIGSDPALVGYINRPLAAAPHTIRNIEQTGVYTINHVEEWFLSKAHQSSAKYADEVSEFDAVGLTPEFTAATKAPFVKESRIKYALSLQQIIPITLNNTFFVIGKIESIYLPAGLVQDDGFLHIEKAGSLCSNGIDGYYSTQFMTRYEYAKADKEVKKLY